MAISNVKSASLAIDFIKYIISFRNQLYNFSIAYLAYLANQKKFQI